MGYPHIGDIIFQGQPQNIYKRAQKSVYKLILALTSYLNYFASAVTRALDLNHHCLYSCATHYRPGPQVVPLQFLNPSLRSGSTIIIYHPALFHTTLKSIAPCLIGTEANKEPAELKG